MPGADAIFAKSFSTSPWWWDGFTAPADPRAALPRHIGTLVIGAGYAGVACALRRAEAGWCSATRQAATVIALAASTASGRLNTRRPGASALGN